jgi:hypothetical protein
LPKSWIENAEEEAGKKIVGIAMEVDGVITLQPVFEKKTLEIHMETVPGGAAK